MTEQPPPPQAPEAEQAVVGALILTSELTAARRLLAKIDATGLELSDFYGDRRALVYGAVRALLGRGDPCDTIAVEAELERTGRLEDAGGRSHVRELAALVPTAANAPHYARLIVEKARARDTIRAAQEIAANAWNGYQPERVVELANRVRTLASHQPGDRSGRGVDGARWIFERRPDQEGAALWGYPNAPLWLSGEPVMLFGPEGVGKSTLAQQIICGRLGITDRILGLPVRRDIDRLTVYVAADRPRQAQRSFARMVDVKHEDVLRDRLHVHQGAPPVDVLAGPLELAEWLGSLGAGTVVVDSLVDLAPDLAKDEVGSRIKAAFREVTTTGIEAFVLHHPRKAQSDNKKPTKIDDVYGSRWITAGMGSILVLWGEPGDVVVELSHLKQPLEEVGPLTLIHDHERGHTTVHEQFDLERLLADRPDGITAKTAAGLMFAALEPSRNQVEKARRRLERLVANGLADRRDAPRPDEPVHYQPRNPA